MKLAVIGLGGRMGHLLNNIFRKEIPDFHVVGLIDPDEVSTRAKLTPEEQSTVIYCRSVKELLKKTKPDAIAIGTRCDLHTPYAVEVLAHSVPLFIEKPVAVTMQQARALEKAAERSRSKTVVSFPMRVSPLCRHVHKMLENGAVGSVEHILGINYVPYGKVYFERWYRDNSIGRGLILQKATHDFDYLSYLAGSPIVRVATMLSQGRVHKDISLKKNAKDESAYFYEKIGTPETGMNEDSSTTLLEFANGAKGVYTQVFFTRRHAARGATISGRLGTLFLEFYERQIKLVRHQEPLTNVTTMDPYSGQHFGGDPALGKNFADVVLRGAASQTPLITGLQSAYACLAANTSARQGKFVAVRQVGD